MLKKSMKNECHSPVRNHYLCSEFPYFTIKEGLEHDLMDFQCVDVTEDDGYGGHTGVYYTAVQTKTRPLTGPSAELVFGENHMAPGSMRCIRLRGLGVFVVFIQFLKC